MNLQIINGSAGADLVAATHSAEAKLEENIWRLKGSALGQE